MGLGANLLAGHFCVYQVMRKTIKQTDTGLTWMERCRCNRYSVIDYSKQSTTVNIPYMTKNWFSAAGTHLKTTGGPKSHTAIKISNHSQYDISKDLNVVDVDVDSTVTVSEEDINKRRKYQESMSGSQLSRDIRAEAGAK